MLEIPHSAIVHKRHGADHPRQDLPRNSSEGVTSLSSIDALCEVESDSGPLVAPTTVAASPRTGSHADGPPRASRLAFHDLNLRHLAAITAIARTGRVRATAAAINMSQPALTQAVNALERQLGTRLFDRLPHGMVPTSTGAMLVNRCERAFSHLVKGCDVEHSSSWLSLLALRGRQLSMRQLRALSAMSRYGNSRSAAEEIGVRHETLVSAIRQLEKAMGIPLLQAEGSSTGLTEAGVRLVRPASLAAAELTAGLEEIGECQIDSTASFAIGTLPLPGMVLLPEAISRFAAAHDRLTLDVVKSTYRDLLAKLRRGEIDFVLGGLQAAPFAEDLAQEFLFEEDLFVVAAHDHPLAGLSLDGNALARFPWVVSPKGSALRAVWEELFENTQRPRRFIQCGSASTTRGLLLSGEWLAILSPGQFRLESSAGILRSIGRPLTSERHRWGIISRRSWQLTQTQQNFLAMLRDVAAEISRA